MLSCSEYSATIENEIPSSCFENYGLLLHSFNLNYKKEGYYWQVGEINRTQGWILHLSAVLSQVQYLLKSILNFLGRQNVPFKIIANAIAAEDLLAGSLGIAQMGKIISIYPENDTVALELAHQLIGLTKSFKGPFIPTDICLGGIVFTRYGSFNPIIKLNGRGIEEKYIYDAKGNLIRDPYAVPFCLPHGVTWPFGNLTEPIIPKPPKLLNYIYKITDTLKPDPRGNVYKGLYVRNFLKVKSCVIKQGFANMSSDYYGRDIRDRLIWQNELSKELADIVPMPAIYDLIQEPGVTILVMEYIKGDSLLDKLAVLNPLSTSWQDRPLANSVQVLKYAIEIAEIISRIHNRGYVHRDVVPVNFLITQKDELYLIDLELAYSLRQKLPDPPFILGTRGFMSPEQGAQSRFPTVKEDIYGLGATLLHLFTELYPIKFNTRDSNLLFKYLYFFVADEEIAAIIAKSLHHDPNLRPAVSAILEVLIKYQNEIQLHAELPKKLSAKQNMSDDTLKDTILSALDGLSNPPIIITNDLWYSKYVNAVNFVANKAKEYALNPGTIEGISGTLYVLARIHNAGQNIDKCTKSFIKGWSWIVENHIDRKSEISAGLYRGAAGIALALAAAIQSGLLEDTQLNRDRIQRLLLSKNDKLNLANGIAGQGISALKCKEYLSQETLRDIQENILNTLFSNQQKNGLWLKTSAKSTKTDKYVPNIGYDDTGIIWYLLAYHSIYPSVEIQRAVTKALDEILSDRKLMNSFNEFVASRNSYEIGDGGKGLIVMLIKAFEVLHQDIYRKVAEDALLKYPRRIVHPNFDQESGLAGLGEVYLEAWRVFSDEEWKYRANWISDVFINCFFKIEGGSGHWVMEQNNPPTADFFTGNSGVLHFLTRCLYPDKIGYRLLN
jgi:serine/threonine protein kinase